ncbi:MAG: GntP family permease [Nocardioidaceae bacterium]
MDHTTQLIIAALVGIAVIIALITHWKLHPFLGLIVGSLVVGAIAGESLNDVLTSFSGGFGDTSASVGILIALGAMLGKLLADSGGADQIVDTLVGRATTRTLPWAMALVGAIIGLPMFFEIGLVLLVPVIFLVSQRANEPLMRVAIPTLAGLSVMHGLVPPHPGPLIAVQGFHANLGLTLGLGLIVAIPTVVVAGPLFAGFAARLVPVAAPELFTSGRTPDGPSGGGGAGRSATSTAQLGRSGTSTAKLTNPSETGTTTPAGTRTTERDSAAVRRPSFPATIATVLLPVVLMLAKAIADIVAETSTSDVKAVVEFVGTPLVALLIAVVVALFTLGRAAGKDRRALSTTLEQSLPPIAGIILIVGAGGGFKQTLIDTGIGTVISDFAKTSSLSVLVLAWLVAALIRLATGSATVATVTATGILSSVATGLSTGETSLMVLAVGCGSLIFSHVNDAGFWLIKEYFGIEVVDTFKTWSVMETIVSVVGIVLVLILGIFV